jgi:membrane AbrB-like protein
MLRRAGLIFNLLLGSHSTSVQWSTLLVLSVLCASVFEVLRLPAALLLGPMAAAILVASGGGRTRVPHHFFRAAQGVIGCLIARSIPLSILSEIIRNWPLFLAAVLSVIVASSVLGSLLMRWRVMPGTTIIWGSSPGAANAMMLMAEAYGADIRLVAFMQYLRVLLVAVIASVVSRIWSADAAGPVAEIAWFPPIAWAHFAETLALVGLGAISVPFLRMPAGPLLLPLVLGVILQDMGLVTIELPPWLLAASYALVGWSIGLRFTRPILVHAARALPRVVASTLVLIAVCGGLAALLVTAAGIDPLTAYLAMSPGAVDSVAIIAAASKLDMPFVMAMQTTRLLLVMLIGPSLARAIAKRAGAAKETA